MFLIFSFQYQKILKLCNPYLGNFRNQIVTQLSHVMCSNLLNQFQQSVKFCCNMVWLNFHFGWVKVHGSILSHLNHHSLLWLPTILYWKEDICNLKMVCLYEREKKKAKAIDLPYEGWRILKIPKMQAEQKQMGLPTILT